MFYHGYDSYMKYAFPHDELKPLSKTYTDSLGELGNLNREHLSEEYSGVALTLIDSMSTLAVLGNVSEFRKNVRWLEEHLDFDVDIRVNAFECNIRVLGGLISTHLLAQGNGAPTSGKGGDRKGSRRSRSLKDGGVGLAMGPGLMPTYRGGLLTHARDLGDRLLRAFDTKTGMPFAWVNLKSGVRTGEVTETNVAAVGSFILEFGVLSRLTGDPKYEDAAKGAIRAMWSLRGRKTNLLGNTLDVQKGTWINKSGGIGAGCDSFFEYLIKAYVMFGDEEYYDIFTDAYVAVMKHYHEDGWYHEAHMDTAAGTHFQATSLQAFWPGMQVLVGDIEAAAATHERLMSVWKRYGVFPERFMYKDNALHPTEKYYPLRPELAESTAMLYAATGDARYQEAGRVIASDIAKHTRVPGGHAAVRDVSTKTLEDHMHSFFLAETCKYLYLLFDDSFLKDRNVVFSTEGHPLPVLAHRPPVDVGNDEERRRSALLARHVDTRRRAVDTDIAAAIVEMKAGGYDTEAIVQEVARRLQAANAQAQGTVCGVETADDASDEESALMSAHSATADAMEALGLQKSYSPTWEDPSAELLSPEHGNAGAGLTARTCPNLWALPGRTAVARDESSGSAAVGGVSAGSTPGGSNCNSKSRAGRKKCLAEEAEKDRKRRRRHAEKAERERDARKKRERERERAADSTPQRAKVKGEESDCHVLDYNDSHTCVHDGDCGVDAATCKKRTCSEHRFCATP